MKGSRTYFSTWPRVVGLSYCTYGGTFVVVASVLAPALRTGANTTSQLTGPRLHQVKSCPPRPWLLLVAPPPPTAGHVLHSPVVACVCA